MFIKKNTVFKILAILFGLIIFILIAETSLQLVSAYLNRSESEALTRDHKYRILALGESTTEINHISGKRGDRSWPGQLQEILNAKNNNQVQIYNFGKSAIRSTTIKNNLVEQIEKYRPQAVIAMMGINDLEALEYLDSKTFFQSLKIVKIFKWLKDSFYNVKIPDLSKQDLLYELSYSINLDLSEKEIIESSESFLPQIDDDIEWFYFRLLTIRLYLKSVTYQLLDSAYSKDNFSKYNKLANKFAIRTYETSGGESVSLKFIMITTDQKKPEEENKFLEILNDAMEKKVEFDNTSVAMFATMYRNHPKFNEYSTRLGIRIRKELKAIDQLRNNYREMALLLKKKNIHFFVMSYPTTKIDVFKSFFVKDFKYDSENIGQYIYRELPGLVVEDQFSNVSFISNENFLNIKDLYKPDYIFTDMFTSWYGGKFGHTTELGYSMISKNVLEQLGSTELIFGKDFKK